MAKMYTDHTVTSYIIQKVVHTQLTLTAIAVKEMVGIQTNFNRTYFHPSLFPSSDGMVELEHQLSERAHA